MQKSTGAITQPTSVYVTQLILGLFTKSLFMPASLALVSLGKKKNRQLVTAVATAKIQ
jgi:hypothetical protein